MHAIALQDQQKPRPISAMIDANLQMLCQMKVAYANYRSDANTWCQFQTSSTVLIDKNAVHMQLGGGVVNEKI